jgi:hypothetical protein
MNTFIKLFQVEKKVEVLTNSLIGMKKWSEQFPAFKKEIDN